MVDCANGNAHTINVTSGARTANFCLRLCKFAVSSRDTNTLT